MRYIAMAIVMALTCLNLSTAQAVTDPFERDSLRGLPGVAVLIVSISPDAQADSLREHAVRRAVELTLRSSGIRVLTPSEIVKMKVIFIPWLRVSVTTAKNGPISIYAYNVSVEVLQDMSLAHRPQHMMLAPTWSTDVVGTIGKSNLRFVTSQIIEPLVKRFANDFLAVNPQHTRQLRK